MGELASIQRALGVNQTAHKETVAGTSNASRRADTALWPEEALRRQVAGALARSIEERALAEPMVLVSKEDADESYKALKQADLAVLEGSRRLEMLMTVREELADKMMLHLKSMLSQCLPPSADAPRSRYARFATSSPAANAVQLILDTSDFLRRTLSITLPSLQAELREVVQSEADRDDTGAIGFQTAPVLSRWWEWLPEAADGAPFVGFDGFTSRYRSAEKAYEEQLASGGRLVALHSMLVRWNDIERRSPPLPAPGLEEEKVIADALADDAGGMPNVSQVMSEAWGLLLERLCLWRAYLHVWAARLFAL